MGCNRPESVSTSEPESGLMVRVGKAEGFFYLYHWTVDHKYNIVMDVHVTPGSVHDSRPPTWIVSNCK